MKWVKVYQTKLEYQAQIVKTLLDTEGYAAIVLNKKDSLYQFGHFEVHTNQDDVLRVLKLINEHINFE